MKKAMKEMRLKGAALAWAAAGLLVAGMALAPLDVHAQVLYGSVVGNVRDASGAAVPQATVTLLNKATNTSREATTDEGGSYTFLDVQTGNYSLKVGKSGFKTVEKTDLMVQLNTVTRFDVSLDVGSITESVTVTAEAAALQTDTSEVHVDVAATELTNLPVPLGRNYQQVYRALPGFSKPVNSHSIPTNPAISLEFNVNGTSDNQNNTRIDGVSTYNIQLPHVTSYVPTLESIQEVNVATNSFDAEQGFAGGAAINVQTKSGGNQMHGSLFEYHTNNHLKAWPMEFDNAGANVGNKPKLIYNQYGGSLGGPIVKDKLFYFASYEGTGNHRGVQRRVTIPTPEARAGDLSALAAALETDVYDPMTGDQTTGVGRTPFISYPTGYVDPAMVNAACTDPAGCLNMIPTSRLDPTAQQILALLPANTNQPGRENSTNNYFVSGPFKYDRHQLDTKINYSATSKLNFVGTFGFLHYSDTTPTVFGDSLVGRPIGGTSNEGHGHGNTYRFTIMGTYTFTPNLVMDAHFGYAKQGTSSEQPGLGTNIGSDVLGIPGTNGTRAFESGWPQFDINAGDDFATMGIVNNFMPYYRHDPQSQYVANFNWIRGKHNIRFGTDFYRMGLNHTQAEFLAGGAYGAQGGFNFDRGFTENCITWDAVNNNCAEVTDSSRANSFATFLLGLPSTASRTFQVPDVMRVRAHLISAYVRDRWNITPKLTLDYGVRWEYIPTPTRTDRGIERYDFTTNTELVCGVGSVPKDCGTEVSRKMFAPRLGFAYRASETFVIRAGYGITYDPYMALEPLRGNYPTMVALIQNAPQSLIPFRRLSDATPSFSSGPGVLPVGIDSIPTPDVGDGMLPMPSDYAFLGYAKNTHRGYVQSWNFTLQKELGWGFTGQAGYVATRTIRQLAFLDLNAGQVPGAGDDGRPLFNQFGRAALTGNILPVGTGHYDSLQVQLQRRLTQGLSLAVNYTWSKTINSVDNSDWTPAIQALPYLGLNRALTSFDRPHNLQIMNIWQLPFGNGKRWLSGQNRVVDAIVSGWQTNTILSLMSGPPFTVSASDNINMPGNTQTADQVKANVTKLGGIGPGTPYYDQSAFADVTAPRFGTSGFNILRGPGIVNWDFGITRDFTITERWKLQFRMESFNFSNTPHFDIPDGSVSDGPDFMTVTGVSDLAREGIDERQFRFGLRLQF
ncbi:MAG: TonB-dependent receptor domain-containing protein [Terriglobia bacterium]